MKNETGVESRKIIDGLYWIHQTHRRSDLEAEYSQNPPDWYIHGDNVYTVQNAYLMIGERTLLFDTIDPVGRDLLLEELDMLLGERSLDYLAVSHPEAPHAGNSFAILDQYPEATFIAPAHGDAHELYHLESAVKAEHGDTIELGNFSLEVLEPTFLDHGLHMWMIDRATKTLFTVDWLGHFIGSTQKLQLTSELSHGLTHHQLLQFHGNVFHWFQYVNTEKTDRAIENIINEYNPSMIAPSHGIVIDKHVKQTMRKVKPVIEQISTQGRLTSL